MMCDFCAIPVRELMTSHDNRHMTAQYKSSESAAFFRREWVCVPSIICLKNNGARP
jgi:hypothetical protein